MLEAIQSKEPVREARWTTWAAWLALALYGACCVSIWTEDAWRAEWDSALYLETARSLAAGEGYTYLGEPFFLRPPGLAWLLSFFVGDGELGIATLNRMMMLFGAGVVASLFWLLRPRIGTPLALAVALLTGTSRLFVQQFNYVLSDFPCALLLFASIALFHVGLTSDDRGGRVRVLAASVCLVAAVYVRTQAVLLLPGLLLYAWSRGNWKRALLPLALVTALTAPWILRARGLANEAPVPATQFMLHDYGTALLHTDPSDPASPLVSAAGWIDRIAANGAGLGASVHESLGLTEPGTRSTGVALLVALLVLTGFVSAARRGWGLFEWYTLANVALLLVYFTYAPRLTMPLVPVLYLYPLIALRKLPGAFGTTACTLVVAGLLALNVSRIAEHREPSRLVQTRTAVAQSIARWVRANTGEDAVILTKQGPIVSLLSGRRTYSYSFDKDPRMLRELGIDYAIFFGRGTEKLERAALEAGGQRFEVPSPMKTLAYRLP